VGLKNKKEDKMKKNLVLVIFIIATFMVATLPVLGSSADSEDYKVIKNAVKGKKGSKIQWFKLSVFDKKAKKSKVKITVPFALVEMLSECDTDELKIKDKCDIDLKKVLEILKKNGPMTLVEVDDDDCLVKIWFE
jgi:hypothetical protein